MEEACAGRTATGRFSGADVDEAMDASAIVLAGMRGAVARWREDGRDRDVVQARLVAIALAAIGGLA